MKRPYTFNPGILDSMDPKIIRGAAIAKGARVRIAREFNPPMYPRLFCMIEDQNGNVMSVFRKALTK